MGIDLDDGLDVMDIGCSSEPPEDTGRVKTLLVLEVTRSEAEQGYNWKQPEKILRLLDEDTCTEKFCILQEDWEALDVKPGDTVYVSGMHYVLSW